MKRCPNCQSNYTNDALTYCLQDGAPLVFVATADEPYDSEKTWVIPDAVQPAALPPTESVVPSPVADHEPVHAMRSQPRQTSPDNFIRPTAPNQAPTAPDSEPVPVTASASAAGGGRKNTMLVAVIAVLLLALGALGAWIFLQRQSESNNDGLTAAERSRRDASGAATQPPRTSSPAPAAGRNDRPDDTRPVRPDQPAPPALAQARTDISNELEDWLESIRGQNLARHLAHYAETLEVYYRERNVPRLRVRDDRQRAFAQYDEMDTRIENLDVQVDPSGTRAVATFDKHYDFRGAKRFAGVARSIFTFARQGERWLIVGEKDL